jgi:flagellar basal-body rod protein FlgB
MVQEKALDAAWLRNDVLAHNLANVDTPLYNRKDVDFESYLRDALYNKDDGLIFHMKSGFRMVSKKLGLESVRGVVTEDYNPLAMRIDGNNVDVDVEMAQMAKNSLKYNTVTSNINGKFSKISHVISEGRR